ncbi:MAG: hypothetical protein N2572_00785 [Syntrophales bacterium]|nr:hypothetical protein [Syntrophales bacterium]
MKSSLVLTGQMPMSESTLVIIDFSGTLSLDMSRFAEPGNLVIALHESGLAEFGVDTVEKFWERIVNPTWVKGATTDVGYANLIVQALEMGENSRVRQAAAEFVRRYMSAATIDQRWRPLLARLWNKEGVRLLIATDHYAEATSAIVRAFKRIDIPAVPLRSFGTSSEKAVLIANSSDLGYFKISEAYWRVVKRVLGYPISKMILIDDFGGAEEKGDAYQEKIHDRFKKTVEAISTVFCLPVITFFFHPTIDFSEVEVWIERQVFPDNAIFSRPPN